MNEKLKEIRIKNGITSNKMAELVGISTPFYSQVENGKRRLTYEMAVKIAKVLKTTPDELFYDDHKKVLETK